MHSLGKEAHDIGTAGPSFFFWFCRFTAFLCAQRRRSSTRV
jgi:hypothetical protein